MTDQTLNYDYTVAHDLCDKTGLVYSDDFTNLADPLLKKHNLTQDQVDGMLYIYGKLTATLFDRDRYSIKGRILVALHFLGLGKRITSDAI
jgi:hypothetical protein